MKRFLIFRLAAFQWAGALHGAQALIPAPGSIIGVSRRSPGPRRSAATGGKAGAGNVWQCSFFFPSPLTPPHTVRHVGGINKREAKRAVHIHGDLIAVSFSGAGWGDNRCLCWRARRCFKANLL